MAAGLGFKTFNTGDVLTAADTNGYLMQGVLVFASAAARDAAITSPQEGQFAYLKDTNVTTYYTGSAWTNLDTTGMVNPMTTTGDSIYSSSGSTPARLGIGSTGQVLTVAGGIPSWATPAGGGGMTLLSTTTLTSSSQVITGISADYTDLVIYVINYKSATDGQYISFRFNNDTTAGRTFRRAYNGSNATNLAFDADSGVEFGGAMDSSVTYSLTRLHFPLYANTSTYKWADFSTLGTDGTTTTNAFYQRGMGGYNQTAAISSLQFLSTAGNLSGSVLIYGVK
jgi:hypothetical protein